MQFGFLKDSEPRVSITPSSLEKFISLGHKVSIEKNDDLLSFFETLEEDDDVQNIFSNVEFVK